MRGKFGTAQDVFQVLPGIVHTPIVTTEGENRKGADKVEEKRR
jgi:hypothetical protein